MSNPTELPELDRLLDRASKIADWLSNAGLPQSAADVATLGALARRAQPEGEAPQADGLTRYSMWSNPVGHGMDPSPSGEWVSFDEVRDLLAAQSQGAQAAMRKCSKFGHRCNCATDCDPDKPHPSVATQQAAAPANTLLDSHINYTANVLGGAPGTPEAPQTAAARDVLAERLRQVEVEGWTPARDDEYVDGQLASAAVAYAQGYTPYLVPSSWPWAVEWFKPADDRRNLVKAGALIVAEIERLDRAAQLDGGQGEGEKA